jgi:hypothetical protein
VELFKKRFNSQVASCYQKQTNVLFFLEIIISMTYVLVDENGILNLRVYSDYPVGIECNQDILLKCNYLIFPCDSVEKHY